ncbi:MAG: PAC2 family protein [Candidatus Tectomicrobia bacterium]|nr:PAC2 family protein [Candidatus Tectomicrobia bacterium]
MNRLSMAEIPQLQNPLLLVAFAGWNDAAESATTAAKFLIDRLGATKFASIDPEEFMNFSEQRPLVSLHEGATRVLTWPTTDFYSVRDPRLLRDLVIGLGVEPHLKWKTYTQLIGEVIRACNVTMVVSLGALLTDVVHSQAVRISGLSTDVELARRLKLDLSRYEGPTGIVGVLHDHLRREGMPSLSLWANCSHYIRAIPNPKAALALVRQVLRILDFTLDLSVLERAAAAFDQQISELIARDPKLASYVKQMELRDEAGGAAEESAAREHEPSLPSGDALAEELQRFLRDQGKRKEG